MKSEIFLHAHTHVGARSHALASFAKSQNKNYFSENQRVVSILPTFVFSLSYLCAVEVILRRLYADSTVSLQIRRRSGKSVANLYDMSVEEPTPSGE